LFSLWADRVHGCSFLDLFAGSGAVGIEAASRGAVRVVLMESDGGVFSTLERNLRHAALPGLEAVRARLPSELERRLPVGERFDLVFADPPYGFGSHRELLTVAGSRLTADGEMALEHRWSEAELAAVTGMELVTRRRYGDSGLTLFRAVAGLTE
jgi:16S rRNA (guanine966-N2)-methyltransferase